MQHDNLALELDGSDIERLIVVSDDLAFLKGLPRGRLPSHTQVRLCASVLRRLLLDNGGELHKIWRLIDRDGTHPLTVEARDLGAFLTQWPSEWIFHAWAGGAEFDDCAHHLGMVLCRIPQEVHSTYPSADDFLADRGMPKLPEKGRFKLDTWLNTPAAAIQTDDGLYIISRRSVINYIANRKGGVHFDPTRDLRVKGIRNRRRNAEYHLLDHGLLRIGHLSGPEYEVVSIAQVVADQDWAAELIRIGAEMAPEEFNGDPREFKFWSGMQEADGTGWATSRFEVSGSPEEE